LFTACNSVSIQNLLFLLLEGDGFSEKNVKTLFLNLYVTFSWDFIYAEYVMAAGYHHRSIVWQVKFLYKLYILSFIWLVGCDKYSITFIP